MFENRPDWMPEWFEYDLDALEYALKRAPLVKRELRELSRDVGKQDAFDSFVERSSDFIHGFLREKVMEPGLKNIPVYRVLLIGQKCKGTQDAIMKCVASSDIGAFWAYDKAGALLFAGGGGKTSALFTAEIRPEDVDWEGSYYTNLIFPEEKELTLKPNTSVRLKRVAVVKDYWGEEYESYKFSPPLVVQTGTFESYGKARSRK